MTCIDFVDNGVLAQISVASHSMLVFGRVIRKKTLGAGRHLSQQRRLGTGDSWSASKRHQGTEMPAWTKFEL